MSTQPTPRIVMVIRLFTPWRGGTQSQAQRLARALIDQGVDVRIVTGWWFRGTPREETIDGVPVFRHHTLWEGFGIRGLRTIAGFLSIGTLWWHLWRRRDSYDVIHVHGLSYHTFAASIAGGRLGKPTLAKLANSGPASDIRKMRAGRHLVLSRRMLPGALRCDRLVALTGTVERELLEAGVPGERIVSIPNGIDPGPEIVRDLARLRRPARVMFVGRLHPQKGVDVLLRAAAALRARRPQQDVRFELVGDGPSRVELIALGRDLGLDGQVRFHGDRDDVATLLGAADVFVLPSRAEGISNALLEAMAAGLPVVATAIPGNTDVISDGRDGILVEAEDPASLADGIERLLDDGDLRARLGREARRTIASRFTIDRVADRYRELYEELIDEGDVRRDPERVAGPSGSPPF